MSANELRMPFAEWLVRMSEEAVPYQARALAIYAVVLKVTANEELACLVGMDTKGVADKTYNKWKRFLSDHGWVIVRQVTVGRTTTIEISPALKETPVIFTDVKPREPRKFYGSSSVTITDVPAVETTAEPEKVTGETRNNYDRDVEVTGNTRAHAEGNNNNYNNNLTNNPCATEAARTRESAGSDDLVTVNGSAIHGPNFKLDFPAIDMAAGLVGADKQRARQIAEICARDWAVNGERPRNPMAQVRAAIAADFQRCRTTDAPKVSDAEGRRERMREHAKSVEEKLNAQKTGYRR